MQPLYKKEKYKEIKLYFNSFFRHFQKSKELSAGSLRSLQTGAHLLFQSFKRLEEAILSYFEIS